ncbi:segregation/condensation protein A [Iamia majanohamensis]|uniref:Segregation and condensation protein A n=1 Tax=Iamia majanohamensis TaxID=467976 RepID=A0AAE9Y8Q7_9ACTN|nr:segregation/condensation protein A [Iamia majanohamensis]WCO69140.1 segregation/condensation protein A [Iamia majanohamensis]
MAYQVQTPVYDGPFDLLLHLILREQVELYDVSLSAVVEAYLGELERMDDLDLDVATEFLLIAATLVELKARRLLPGDAEVDLDDELALWEERDLLLARLLECKTFKDASAVLAGLADVAARSWPRRVGPEDAFLDLTPDVMAGVTPESLRAAFLRASAPRPEPRVDLDHVAPIGVSVADAVAELVDELPRVGRIGFRALTAALVDRIEVVVRFLAVLELCKQGLVDLDQAERFGDIRISWVGPGDEEPGGVLAGALGGIDRYEG